MNAWRGTEPINTKTGDYEFHVDYPKCNESISILLRYLLLDLRFPSRELVILCIGTDRCTGDALGPIIGTQLNQAGLPGISVYGTLENPVHATNLEETLQLIAGRHQHHLTVAIDACLGKQENVGKILIGKGPLKPGSGVNKTLPAVGDVYIIGMVNVGGFMDHFTLQNTRLYLIMRLAQAIADGLVSCLGDLGLDVAQFAALD